MDIKYTKWPKNMLNSRKMYQHFLFHGPPKFTQIGTFVGLKIYHLATLVDRLRNGQKFSYANKQNLRTETFLWETQVWTKAWIPSLTKTKFKTIVGSPLNLCIPHVNANCYLNVSQMYLHVCVWWKNLSVSFKDVPHFFVWASWILKRDGL
jgi:hypothetical protein